MYKKESRAALLQQSLQGNLCCQCPHCVFSGAFTSHQLLSGFLLPWAESTFLGVASSKNDAVPAVPGCTKVWAKYSTQAYRDNLQQITLCISPSVNSQMLMPPWCSSHQLLCAYFVASHWGLVPQVRPLSGTEITWQSDSCHLNWNHPLSPC